MAYTATMRLLLVLTCVTFVAAVVADEPLTAEEMANADVEALELDPIEVTGEGWSFEQEVTLRMVRRALDQPRSTKRKDRDVWVCWIEDSTGSHLSYLNCARNGDLWALQPADGLERTPVLVSGYGTIMRSTRPVNRWKLERAMETLPGSEAFDEEFLLMALTGERPPRDIPDDEELDQFARAYYRVERLAKRGVKEDRQIKAILDEGLTLERYNRVVDLVKTYRSIENDVAERLKNVN